MPHAFSQMAKAVPLRGDGSSPDKPKTFVFFASDGLANSVRKAPNGAWLPDANWRGVLPSTHLDYSQ